MSTLTAGVMAHHLRMRLVNGVRRVPYLIWCFFSLCFIISLGLYQSQNADMQWVYYRPVIAMFLVGFLGGISTGPLTIGSAVSRETVALPTLPIAPQSRSAMESLGFVLSVCAGVALALLAGDLLQPLVQDAVNRSMLTSWWPGTASGAWWLLAMFAGGFAGHMRLHAGVNSAVPLLDLGIWAAAAVAFGMALPAAAHEPVFAVGILGLAVLIGDRPMWRVQERKGSAGPMYRPALGGAAQLGADMRAWLLPGLGRTAVMCVATTFWFVIIPLLTGEPREELRRFIEGSVLSWPYLLLCVWLLVPMGITRYTAELDGSHFARSWSTLPVPRRALMTHFATYGAVSLGLALLLSLGITGVMSALDPEGLFLVSATCGVVLAVTAPLFVLVFVADCVVPRQDNPFWPFWGLGFIVSFVIFHLGMVHWLTGDDRWVGVAGVMAVSAAAMGIIGLRAVRVVQSWVR